MSSMIYIWSKLVSIYAKNETLWEIFKLSEVCNRRPWLYNVPLFTSTYLRWKNLKSPQPSQPSHSQQHSLFYIGKYRMNFLISGITMRFSTTMHFRTKTNMDEDILHSKMLKRKQDPHCHFPTINSSGSNDCQVHAVAKNS